MKRILSVLLLTVGISLAMAVNAAAYLDPSAMTFIIQIIAGIAITCGATFAVFRRRIVLFFRKRFGNKKPNQSFLDDFEDDDDNI